MRTYRAVKMETSIHTLQYTIVFSKTTGSIQKARFALLKSVSRLLRLVQYSPASDKSWNVIIIAHFLLPEP